MSLFDKLKLFGSGKSPAKLSAEKKARAKAIKAELDLAKTPDDKLKVLYKNKTVLTIKKAVFKGENVPLADGTLLIQGADFGLEGGVVVMEDGTYLPAAASDYTAVDGSTVAMGSDTTMENAAAIVAAAVAAGMAPLTPAAMEDEAAAEPELEAEITEEGLTTDATNGVAVTYTEIGAPVMIAAEGGDPVLAPPGALALDSGIILEIDELGNLLEISTPETEVAEGEGELETALKRNARLRETAKAKSDIKALEAKLAQSERVAKAQQKALKAAKDKLEQPDTPAKEYERESARAMILAKTPEQKKEVLLANPALIVLNRDSASFSKSLNQPLEVKRSEFFRTREELRNAPPSAPVKHRRQSSREIMNFETYRDTLKYQAEMLMRGKDPAKLQVHFNDFREWMKRSFRFADVTVNDPNWQGIYVDDMFTDIIGGEVFFDPDLKQVRYIQNVKKDEKVNLKTLQRASDEEVFKVFQCDPEFGPGYEFDLKTFSACALQRAFTICKEDLMNSYLSVLDSSSIMDPMIPPDIMTWIYWIEKQLITEEFTSLYFWGTSKPGSAYTPIGTCRGWIEVAKESAEWNAETNLMAGTVLTSANMIPELTAFLDLMIANIKVAKVYNRDQAALTILINHADFATLRTLSSSESWRLNFNLSEVDSDPRVLRFKGVTIMATSAVEKNNMIGSLSRTAGLTMNNTSNFIHLSDQISDFGSFLMEKRGGVSNTFEVMTQFVNGAAVPLPDVAFFYEA